MTNENKLPAHIQARYGLTGRRFPKYLPSIVLVVVLVSIMSAIYFQNQKSPVSFKLIAFSVISEKQIQVTWSVDDVRDSKIYCVVRAQDVKRQDVGYATIPIAITTGPQINYTVNTSDRAVLAEVLGCDKSMNMRVPPANFPPGVKIPTQSPPGLAPSQ